MRRAAADRQSGDLTGTDVTSIEIPTTALRLRSETPRSVLPLVGWAAIAFGSLFVAASGGLVARAALGGQVGVHAPLWVLGVAGLTFALAGLYVAASGALDVRRRRAVEQLAATMPGQPWQWDYEWRADGIGNDTAREIVRAFAGAAFLAIFIAPFHWVGLFAAHAERVFAIGALLVDVAIVAVLVRGTRLVLMRRRYGRSWLRFGRFPFHPGERLDVSLDSFGGTAGVQRLTALLHCVQERYETTGSGRNRRTEVACYSLWSTTGSAEKNRNGLFEFSFEIPAGLPSSALSERPARFWELTLHSDDVAGVDYSASFFLPVYGAAH